MDKFFTVKEREKLYNEIWEEPVSTVAKRYGISDTALRKRCNKLNIPLPPRGYWEKIKSGQRIKKPELSKVFGKYVKIVRKTIINYKYNAYELTDDKLLILKDEELSLLTDDSKQFIKEKCDNVIVKNQLRNPHQLIKNHQEEIVNRKQKEKELKERRLLFSRFYSEDVTYKDFKASLPINVSDDKIKRVYRILGALFKTIEVLEGNISVQPYIGKDAATINLGNHLYDFEVKEINSKAKTKANGDSSKSIKEQVGTIVLMFTVSSCYGKELTICLEYKDSESDPLENKLGNIIYSIFVSSNKLDILEELSSRKIDRRREEEKRKQHLEELKKREVQRISKLEGVVSNWDKAQKMRGFAESLYKKIGGISDEVEKEKAKEYIKWIRDKADWIDPLVSREDELLGRKYHGLFSTIEE
jgi:hypothetical protein